MNKTTGFFEDVQTGRQVAVVVNEEGVWMAGELRPINPQEWARKPLEKEAEGLIFDRVGHSFLNAKLQKRADDPS